MLFWEITAHLRLIIEVNITCCLQLSYSPPFWSRACNCARLRSAASSRSLIAFSSRCSFSFSSFSFNKFDFRFSTSTFSVSLSARIASAPQTEKIQISPYSDEPVIMEKSTLRSAFGMSDANDRRGDFLCSSSCLLAGAASFGVAGKGLGELRWFRTDQRTHEPEVLDLLITVCVAWPGIVSVHRPSVSFPVLF